MRLLIVSDIHANIAALQAIREDVDAVAFLGDAVDYGPFPAECISWLRERVGFAVRGNHDNAVGYDEDPRCAPMFREMAEATRQVHRSILSPVDLGYLRSLPLTTEFEFGGARFCAVHAAPTDPLYRYMPPDATDEMWGAEVANVGAGVLLVGHTHHPFVRTVGATTVVNPGSVGQPKHGDPRAAYALWEDGRVTLRRVEYPVEETVRALRALPLPADVLADLVNALHTGGA
jgi:putative phosphoesterase